MAICGAEHGKVCAEVQNIKDDVSILFLKCDNIVGFKFFMAVLGFIAMALSVMFGYSFNTRDLAAANTTSTKVIEAQVILSTKRADTMTETLSRVERKLDRLNGKAKDD